ncbi:hypothetical protein [Cyanobium sp. Morenito 9A2]|uniref:hypothetical protein n=1 Tax=Cyanobium sp. Morenito 9A2 TaxID=2823718 RepID=UPI0020CE493E|nr:hypothetical protein [Cyanobium sp. Morenito 9A2]MCP9850342.1 hypothetical protein [Cyanobium sp. Morenito 9A2]
MEPITLCCMCDALGIVLNQLGQEDALDLRGRCSIRYTDDWRRPGLSPEGVSTRLSAAATLLLASADSLDSVSGLDLGEMEADSPPFDGRNQIV